MADPYEVRGVDDMRARLRKLAQANRAEAGEALFDASEHVLGEARKIVPWQDGDLERSGKASHDPDQLVAVVSFDTPYAVRQHEDMTARHSNGRRAKYLEAAMRESAGDVGQIIAGRLRRLWGR